MSTNQNVVLTYLPADLLLTVTKTLDDSFTITNGHGRSSLDAVSAVEVTSLARDHVLKETVSTVAAETLLQLTQQLGCFYLCLSCSCAPLLLGLDLLLQLDELLLFEELNAGLGGELDLQVRSLGLAGVLAPVQLLVRWHVEELRLAEDFLYLSNGMVSTMKMKYEKRSMKRLSR